MKNLALAILLSSSLIASTASAAGPSSKSDKVITGIIFGVTAAALITALANADQGEPHPQPRKHKSKQFKHKHHPHRFEPPRRWRDERWHRHERFDWRERRFNDRKRHWSH